MASLGRHLHHFSFNTIGENWSPRPEDLNPPEISDEDALEALHYHGIEDDNVVGVGDRRMTKVCSAPPTVPIIIASLSNPHPFPLALSGM